MTTRESIQCPLCGQRSYHPKDISERYCGACNRFHDEVAPTRPTAFLLTKRQALSMARVVLRAISPDSQDDPVMAERIVEAWVRKKQIVLKVKDTK